jgi:hypothetical protein
VHFEVDATDIQGCQALRGKLFDLIQFQFPHVVEKGHIEMNRELLAGFFASASRVLQPVQDTTGSNSSVALPEVRVTLARGQGGTPAEKPQREWHNSWQIVEQAGRAGLVLESVVEFKSSEWQVEGYASRGYRRGTQGFCTEGGLTHVFVPECCGVKCLFPHPHTHDVSLWVGSNEGGIGSSSANISSSCRHIAIAVTAAAVATAYGWGWMVCKDLALAAVLRLRHRTMQYRRAGSSDGKSADGRSTCDHILEIAYSVAGRVNVEGVELLEEFLHPKVGRLSQCYRVVYCGHGERYAITVLVLLCITYAPPPPAPFFLLQGRPLCGFPGNANGAASANNHGAGIRRAIACEARTGPDLGDRGSTRPASGVCPVPRQAGGRREAGLRTASRRLSGGDPVRAIQTRLPALGSGAASAGVLLVRAHLLVAYCN